MTAALLSGGLFCLVMGAPPVITTPRGFIFYYPGVDYQTGAEAFIVALLTLMGVAGLIAIHHNASKPQSEGRSLAFTLLGLFLILMCVLALAWFMYLKILFYI